MMEELPEDLESFMDRVYWLVQQIPEGKVATYGQIATYAGSARAPRAVGNLMRDSFSNGVELPWQRVINSTGGISYKGDVTRAELQRELLIDEGISFNRKYQCDLKTYRWAPESVFWMDE